MLLSTRIPQIEVSAFGDTFFVPGDDPLPHRANARNAWRFMEERLSTCTYDLLVLDELALVLALDFLSMDEVIRFLDHKGSVLHVIITGRNAPHALIERAHVVTEMREVKHAYAIGWPAVEGIDF